MTLIDYFIKFCDNQQELSYKKICDITNEPYYTGGNVKKKEIEYWNNFVNMEKNKNKYKFISMKTNEDILNKKKFNEIKYFNDLNLKSDNHNKYKNFNISKDDCTKSGVYKIQLNNEVYIGQTKNFIERFRRHYGNGKAVIRKMLRDGASFNILEFENDKNKRIKLEKKWILYYKNNIIFDVKNIMIN